MVFNDASDIFCVADVSARNASLFKRVVHAPVIVSYRAIGCQCLVVVNVWVTHVIPQVVWAVRS